MGCWMATWKVDTSMMYHLVKSQSVIKLYIFYNMLEVGDRLFSAFGQDTIDALLWTATEQYHYQAGTRMQPAPLDAALADHARHLALWGSLAYDHHWYRLPAADTAPLSVASTGTGGAPASTGTGLQ